ncbi:hypothetical protein ACFSW6_06225 [Comamonas terrae]|uniref:Uncharacterized protein n=1 Tax=Comamonas terrae TaxID=673548 RepID=A0ABW5UJF5_9BURK
MVGRGFRKKHGCRRLLDSKRGAFDARCN